MTLLALGACCTLLARTPGRLPGLTESGGQSQNNPQQPPTSAAQTSPTTQQSTSTNALTSPTPLATSSSLVVVLNPAHGGTDTGARGENGVAEKDVVLEFARVVKGALEAQGIQVLMTRNDDSNPSYDDRASIANAYRNSIFISIHVASTGTLGTARAYYYQFWTPFGAASSLATTQNDSLPQRTPGPATPSLIPWEEAQRPYAGQSRRFAEILQGELTQRFSGSPAGSMGIPIRGLRSVEAPAVAVEISSVSVSDASSLSAMAAPLATSVVRAIQSFHPAGPAVTP